MMRSHASQQGFRRTAGPVGGDEEEADAWSARRIAGDAGGVEVASDIVLGRVTEQHRSSSGPDREGV